MYQGEGEVERISSEHIAVECGAQVFLTTDDAILSSAESYIRVQHNG